MTPSAISVGHCDPVGHCTDYALRGGLDHGGWRGIVSAVQAATLEILEKANVPPAQARAFAQAIEIELAAQRDTLATKLDLTDLRRELEVRIESVKSEIVRWVFLCVLGQTAVLLGAAYFFVTRLR